MLVKLIDTPEDPVRLAFVHVFSKRPGMTNADGSKSPDKFEINPIFRPDGANAQRLRDAITEVAKEKYGTKIVKDDDGNEVPAYKLVLSEFEDDQAGIRKGNRKKDKSGNIYDGFEGMSYVVARNEARPLVIDRDKTPLSAEDGRPYGGCYGTVHVDVWALNKPGLKKRIVTDQKGVQFTRDGDAFSAGAPPAKPDDFDNLSAANDGDEDAAAALMG